MSQRFTGTVKSFDNAKGYGYIETSLGADVFVYYQSILGKGFKNLLVGDRVEFSMIHKPSGPVALEVTRV